LGHGYSYGDIKLVLAHRKHLASKWPFVSDGNRGTGSS
jgi:hypothetical protein